MIVWLASYPRSGNTFFRIILNKVFNIKTYSLYDDLGDIGADKKTAEIVGHEFLPENFSIEKARADATRYYIKTHELPDNRIANVDKVIYLIRDGREATLSFTKHQNEFSNQNKSLLDTIYGNTFIGSWGEHVISWNPKKRENTLLIKFEELIREPIKFINILKDFLELEPRGNKIPTFEELKKINPKFFRSGKTNSWEEEFSDDDHLSFWLMNYKAMEEYGYIYKKPKDLEKLLNNNSLEHEILKQNYYLIWLNINHAKDMQSKLNDSKITQKKTDIIDSKKNIIKEKDKQIVKQKELIKQKDKQIAEQRDIISRQETIIQKQKELIKQKDKQIAEQKELIINNERLIEQLHNELDMLLKSNRELFNEINEIKKSKKYKLATLISYPYLKTRGKV